MNRHRYARVIDNINADELITLARGRVDKPEVRNGTETVETNVVTPWLLRIALEFGLFISIHPVS